MPRWHPIIFTVNLVFVLATNKKFWWICNICKRHLFIQGVLKKKQFINNIYHPPPGSNPVAPPTPIVPTLPPTDACKSACCAAANAGDILKRPPGPKLMEHTETYLDLYQTSMMVLSCKNSYQVKTVDYLHKKASS